MVNTNSTDIQIDILMKIREVYDVDLSDRMLLISIFSNFRTGGGLRLSELGYDICVKNSLFEFTPIKLDKKNNNYMSKICTILDRICTSPYYIKGDKLLLSDELVLTALTFCVDQFDKLYKTYT